MNQFVLSVVCFGVITFSAMNKKDHRLVGTVTSKVAHQNLLEDLHNAKTTFASHRGDIAMSQPLPRSLSTPGGSAQTVKAWNDTVPNTFTKRAPKVKTEICMLNFMKYMQNKLQKYLVYIYA